MIDADTLERRVDDSLRRLGVGRIDVLHLHAVGPERYGDVCREYLPRLERLRAAGKIRFTGVSERFGSDTTHEMARRAAADGFFDVMMLGLNYVNQTAVTEVLPLTRAAGIGTLCMFAVRGPLADRQSAEAIVRKLVGTGEIDPSAIDAGDRSAS